MGTINQVGKKGREWIRERARLIKEAIAEGRIIVRQYKGFPEGRCEDCREWRQLDPDHWKKRSQGGEHTKENIIWRCRRCHDKIDNMPDSKKQSGKKAEWQKKHICVYCKKWTSFLLCNFCGRYSIKLSQKNENII